MMLTSTRAKSIHWKVLTYMQVQKTATKNQRQNEKLEQKNQHNYKKRKFDIWHLKVWYFSIFGNHRLATHWNKIKPRMVEVFSTQNVNWQYHICNTRERHFYKIYKKHIHKTIEDDTCRAWPQNKEAIQLVISGCPVLSPTK